jgi:hypothetical protein
MKIRTLLAVLTFVLLAPAAASAQIWTAAPGAGVIDEQCAGIYNAETGSLGYNTSGSTARIIARYNLYGTGIAPWTTMEVRAYDPSASSEVKVQVFRLSAGGAILGMGTCISNNSSVISSTQCPLDAPINFDDGGIYTVQVSISRSSTSVSPLFTGARLF